MMADMAKHNIPIPRTRQFEWNSWLGESRIAFLVIWCLELTYRADTMYAIAKGKPGKSSGNKMVLISNAGIRTKPANRVLLSSW